jgi:membrane protein
MNPRAYLRFVGALYNRAIAEDHCPTLAASVSFYAVLSSLPFLILAVSISSFFVESSSVTLNRIRDFLSSSLPVATESSLELLDSTIANKTIFGLVGLFGLIWGSMRIFSVLEEAMNRIWRPEQQRSYWESKFVSLIFVPIMGVFLFLSILLTGLISVAKRTTIPWLDFSLADLPGVAGLITLLAPVLVSTLLFLAVYYLLPKKWNHLRSAFWGAVIASVLWEIAKLLFDQYITNFSSLQTVYGSFASLAILFLWVYYSSFIVLLGAEIGSLLQKRKEELR